MDFFARESKNVALDAISAENVIRDVENKV